jgi:hypothetical protein
MDLLSDAEQRVARDLAAGRVMSVAVAVAVAVGQHDLVAANDSDSRAGDGGVLDPGVHELVDAGGDRWGLGTGDTGEPAAGRAAARARCWGQRGGQRGGQLAVQRGVHGGLRLGNGSCR